VHACMHLLLCYTAPQRCTCAHDVTSSPQMRTVPYLVDNPRVGFVQARWAFLNAEESFLTKARRPGGLFSSGGVCAYCGMSPEWALISPGPLVRLPLRALARLTPARRACARAGAADLAQLPLQVRAVCALCDRRVLQLQRHRRRVPRRPAPPRPAPRLPSGALAPGALAVHRRRRVWRMWQSRASYIRISRLLLCMCC